MRKPRNLRIQRDARGFIIPRYTDCGAPSVGPPEPKKAKGPAPTGPNANLEDALPDDATPTESASQAGRNPHTWAKVSQALIFDRTLSAEAKLVGLALSTYADRAGECFPAVSTLAATLGLSRRTAQRHLRALEQAGHLVSFMRTRTNGRGGQSSNGYRLAYRAARTRDADADGAQGSAEPSEAFSEPEKPITSGATPDVAPKHENMPSVRRLVTPGATFGDTFGATPDVALTIPIELNQENYTPLSPPKGGAQANENWLEGVAESQPTPTLPSPLPPMQPRPVDTSALHARIVKLTGDAAMGWEFLMDQSTAELTAIARQQDAALSERLRAWQAQAAAHG